MTAMHMVADPKRRQLGLPVNQTPAMKIKEVDKGMGGLPGKGKSLSKCPQVGSTE